MGHCKQSKVSITDKSLAEQYLGRVDGVLGNTRDQASVLDLQILTLEVRRVARG